MAPFALAADDSGQKQMLETYGLAGKAGGRDLAWGGPVRLLAASCAASPRTGRVRRVRAPSRSGLVTLARVWLAFFKTVADAPVDFIALMERYLASTSPADRPWAEKPAPRHGRLALEHGIATHRVSLQWARSAMETLARPGLS